MSNYLSEFWWGYLTHVTIEKCVAISKERCPGCSKGFKTSLLHAHQQASLLNKLESYLNEARGSLSSNFDEMFDDFQKRMDCPVTSEERQVLITSGRSFLFIVTPPSLFYGRYLTDEKYSHLFTDTYIPKIDPPKRKKAKPDPENIPPKKKKPSKPTPQSPPSRWNSANFNLETMYDSDI